MENCKLMTAACLLVASAAATAFGQCPVVVDGTLDNNGAYGTPLFVQSNQTGFGNAAQTGLNSGAGVATGVEIAIPLSALGNPAGEIKLLAAITSGSYDFWSNQITGSLPANSGHLADRRDTDFGSIPGDQFISFTPATVGLAETPTIDGLLDATYGAALFVQSNYTSFGNPAQTFNPYYDGSEIDGFFAVKDSTTLYVFVSGNLQTNFNKLCLFIDSKAGGQHTLRADNSNPEAGFNDGVSRMSGLTFDTGFTPDYFIVTYIGYRDNGTQNGAELGMAMTNLLDSSGGVFGTDSFRLGACLFGTPNGTLGASLTDTAPPIPPATTGNSPIPTPGAPVFRAMWDNSNIAGVGGSPSGGPTVDLAAGSEIDNVYGYASNGKLHLFLGGNIESSGNRLDLFIDCGPGGQNVLRGDNGIIDNLNNMQGLTFDGDFSADYWIGSNTFVDTGVVKVFSNASSLNTNGMPRNGNGKALNFVAYSGGDKATNNPVSFGGPRIDALPAADPDANSYTEFAPREALAALGSGGTPAAGKIRVSINNSNSAGVDGGSGLADSAAAALVATGIEYEIDLAELDWDGVSPIRVAGWVNNGDHNYMSNQVIGGFEFPRANLGADMNGGFTGTLGGINFGALNGNQFVVVPVLCPADINRDGTLDSGDYLDFLLAFAGGDCLADFNQDGTIDSGDYLDYLLAFASAC